MNDNAIVAPITLVKGGSTKLVLSTGIKASDVLSCKVSDRSPLPALPILQMAKRVLMVPPFHNGCVVRVAHDLLMQSVKVAICMDLIIVGHVGSPFMSLRSELIRT